MKYILTKKEGERVKLFKKHIVRNEITGTISCGIPTIADVISYYEDMKTAINGVVTDVDNQIAIYGRMGRYNDSTWAVAGGTINSDVKRILDKDFDFFQNIEQIKLPNGDVLDSPHFWAVINTLFKGNGDLGGWAGDLVQFAQDVKNNPSVSFPSGQFGKEDWVSDADAYNIYKNYSTNILEGLKNYFTKNLTESVRVNEFITSDNIETRYGKSPNKILLSGLAMKYQVTNDNIKQAAQKMQNYLDANK